METIVRECGINDIVDLRHRGLRAGLARETAVFAGDELGTTLHLGAWVGDRVCGCLSLHRSVWEGEAAYQLRGMAVEAEVRGMGVGRRLMEVAEGWVRERGVGVMWCNARVPAAGFYRGMGWEVVGGEFEIPTAGPHVRMVRVL